MWVVSARDRGGPAVGRGPDGAPAGGPRACRGRTRLDSRTSRVLTVAAHLPADVFRTWSFLRYFAVLAPLLLILAFAALLRLGAGRADAFCGARGDRRRSSWCRSTARGIRCRAPCSARSLSASATCTMSSITDDVRGRRRATSSCYNLQFTGFHWALNAMYAALQPTASTTIVFPRFNRWGLWSPLDARTFERVAARTGTVTPDYADEAHHRRRVRDAEAARALARGTAERRRHARRAAASHAATPTPTPRDTPPRGLTDHRASSGTARRAGASFRGTSVTAASIDATRVS